MDIVSFNIRCDCSGDGINCFDNRKADIKTAIEKRLPDIIGFQEVTETMVAWLNDNLPQYNLVGCGRDCNRGGEHMLLACRKDSVNILALDTFWLSETPTISGTRFEKQSIFPRICCVAMVRHSGKLMRVYFTHLDHESDEARRLGFGVILDRIETQVAADGLPFILLGDFNAMPNELDFPSIAKTRDVSMTDITSGIDTTFHDFGRNKVNEKIDYIFTSDEFSCSDVTRWLECHDGIFLSDHYPLEAKITL